MVRVRRGVAQVGETLGNLGSRLMIASPCRRSGWSAWPAESPAGWAVPPDYASFFTLDKGGERAETLATILGARGAKMEILVNKVQLQRYFMNRLQRLGLKVTVEPATAAA